MRGARPERALEIAFARATRMHDGAAVLVALSGGSDSVALLALAARHAADRHGTIVAVHVHHGLRASADQDAAVALAACSRLAVPLQMFRVRARRRDEAHLRELRYEALQTAARRYGATRILTGHTAQDQTETVLLALFRGTGQAGLMGIAPERELAPGLRLERPLLRLDRAALRAYCARLQLPYVVDPTNADVHYRRNAVRAALTVLRPQFPGLDRAVARCAAILRDGATASERGPAAAMLRTWLAEQGLPMPLSAERVESIIRLIDIGAGRRLRISLESHPKPAPESLSRGEATTTQYDEEE